MVLWGRLQENFCLREGLMFNRGLEMFQKKGLTRNGYKKIEGGVLTTKDYAPARPPSLPYFDKKGFHFDRNTDRKEKFKVLTSKATYKENPSLKIN